MRFWFRFFFPCLFSLHFFLSRIFFFHSEKVFSQLKIYKAKLFLLYLILSVYILESGNKFLDLFTTLDACIRSSENQLESSWLLHYFFTFILLLCLIHGCPCSARKFDTHKNRYGCLQFEFNQWLARAYCLVKLLAAVKHGSYSCLQQKFSHHPTVFSFSIL